MSLNFKKLLLIKENQISQVKEFSTFLCMGSFKSQLTEIIPFIYISATLTLSLMAESEELKSFLTKVKEESEKIGLKLDIQKTKIMASSSITSWQIDGETIERVADFILGGSKITADDDCSHEINRHLLLRRKVLTNIDSILKSRDITLSTKVWFFQ